MSVAAVIPVKPLERALGRLSPVLDRAARRDLQWEMLGAVLGACAEASRLDGVVVVTGDRAVGGLARAFGARVVPDHRPPRGMNAAVIAGCDVAAAAGARAALVLTADLPLATAADLDAVIARAPAAPGIVCVPSRDGTGTNALLMCGPRAIAPHLGPCSLAAHEAEARRRRVTFARCPLPALALDVDTPEDLAVLGEIAPGWVDAAGMVLTPA